MYKFNFLALLFIIIQISYYVNAQTDRISEINNCLVIYIPVEKLTYDNQDYNMVLFKKELEISRRHSEEEKFTFNSQNISYGNPPQTKILSGEIYGSSIYFDEENYGTIIVNNYEDICQTDYENKETEVKDSGNNIIGYVYRNSKLNESNYSNITEEQLIEFAKEVASDSQSLLENDDSVTSAVAVDHTNYDDGVETDCVVIYIPEEKLTFNNQNYNMVLFKRTSIGSSRGDGPVVTFLSQDINYGNPQKIKLRGQINTGGIVGITDISAHRRIVLDNTYDDICLPKYENKELKVQDGSDILVGYVYRNSKLNENSYLNRKEEDLIRYAREVVINDEGGNHFAKRSNYLLSCISGNNYEFARMRCYELPVNQTRKAYITKPYTLYSINILHSLGRHLNITVAHNETYWFYEDFKYFHPEIKPEQVSDDKHSPCYYKGSVGNVYGGRLLYIKDKHLFTLRRIMLNQSKVRRYLRHYTELRDNWRNITSPCVENTDDSPLNSKITSR